MDVSKVVAEMQSGAPMMELLVPKITTHALSYLDYPSLCRLFMSNWLIRKVANDDNAWKSVYHKVLAANGYLWRQFGNKFKASHKVSATVKFKRPISMGLVASLTLVKRQHGPWSSVPIVKQEETCELQLVFGSL
ncbi:hypothetical protein V6N13_036474 [Hibiscus sabdariffa]